MRILLLFLLLAVFPFSGSQAATVDIYKGEAIVENKEAGARKRALPEALRNVLQKFSGLPGFDDYPTVEIALADASSILVSFYYRNVTVALADGSEIEELRLVAEFDERKVNELARSLQLPLWPAERDPMTLWVVVDDGLDRRILPVEFAYAWESMNRVAQWRGLPVTWPSADEEGRFEIDPQLLWGGYTEDLGMAPGAGAMIAAARREGLEWSVRVNTSYGEENWTWRVQDLDLQAALVNGLQQAIDLVAADNVIAAADLGTWDHEISVTGVVNSREYERCLAYLQGLGVVNRVTVVSASSGKVIFGLELSALPQYLEDSLADDGVLQLSESEDAWELQR